SLPPPCPTPTLLPYTTLFRSDRTPMVLLTVHDERRCRRAMDPRRRRPLDQELPDIRDLAAPLGRCPDMTDIAGAVERLQVEDGRDRKSTRLNSSHVKISYAVF